MNITPISESAVVCSLPPPASLQQQRQLWAFANQLQSEKDIVEVVVGMNNLTVFTDFYVDFAPLIQTFGTILGRICKSLRFKVVISKFR